ncbi:DNA-DIRECTED RNA polymerase V SUBUNIT 1 [Salix purpurea]|uniref:DNA-directed RNA polymerase subunit n=1 Tax=Salix purpurea TaxID=77065 RepID=A0A9Q0T8Q0_SALPP|nr:DNA-DIRECTED RNA polymerase V SUBUNIT 1 [Salix purpurea]
MDENSQSSIFEGEITGIRFGLATQKEICTASISDCPISHSSQLTNPFLGLPLEFGKCESCGTSEPGKCEGHFGYIDLPIPIYHPSHISELKRMLSLICLKCLKLKRNKIQIKSNGIAERLLSCCEECAQISIREVTNTDGACFLELKLPSRSRLRDGCWNFLERYGFRYGDDFTRPLLPCEVMQILKRFPLETRKKLSGKGYFPQDGYILQQLPVPPNCLSVPVVSDGDSIMSSDLSISMLKKVLKQAEVIKNSRSGSPNFDAHKDEANSLQSMVDQYLQVRGTTKTSRGVDTRYGGSGFSSRSVITGDAYTLVNQVGIPYEIAQRITFEERVSVHNMRYLQELVDNKLCLTYKDGSSTYSLREGSKGHTFLRPGQVVHRRIMDGDIVFINRPPTTHKHSLQALSVYVHDDHAVKINPLICGPLSADFDGDCVHLFYPQSLAAKAEVLELFSVEKQLLSSHSGNLNLQLTTDSLLSLKMMFKAFFLGKSAAQQLAMFISPYLPQPALLKVNCFCPHWTAHQILQMALPACFNCSGETFLIINSNFLKVDFNRDVVASIINEILITMFFEKGSGAVLQFFNSLQPMLMENLFSEGFSVSLEDFSISRAAKQRIQESFKAISPLLCNLRSTFNELVELQVENHIRDVKQPVREFILTSSALGYLIDSKSDAAVSKVVQQIGFLGLQVSDRGKLYSKTLVEDLASHFQSKYPANLVDYTSAQYGLIQNSFFHGLDAYEEMAHSISTREVIVRSSRGLSEPGTLFKNLMAILRDVVICYDGTVRNVSSNSIIQFEYGVKVGTESQSLFPAGEPVGVLAATAMSNPAYKAVLDSTPSSNSSWDMMKEILLCKVGFKNDLADQRVILYLNDCGCGRNYCQERAAYLVKNHLEKVSLKDIAKCFMIEYKSQQVPDSFGSDAGLVGHVHLDERKLQDLNISTRVILEKCQETVNSFRKKKKIGNLFKRTTLVVSESCSFQQCIDESPCLMFFWQGADDFHLERTSNILADMICPVLLETIIKGDHRISRANIIWATPETTTWISNSSRTQKGELALDIVLEKSAVKKSGDAWRIVLDSCLPVLHLINTTRSIPYAIKQVQELLGVSCAFDQAVQRLSKSVTMVAKGVLKEHLILLGNSMTCAGSLIGFYTGGYKTLSRSLDIQVPFTEATLFTPRKCFEKAAEKCHTDSLSSIVASCAWGKHVTVGTGSHFDVLWDTKEACLNPEGSMDPYSFLNMVRSTAGGEESVTACLGAEVDDLMLEDEDWNLSPEHNSSYDKPTFEDSAEFEDFLGNQSAESNWEKKSSLKDGSRSSGNWDVDKNDGSGKEKPWSLGMNTAEENDVASSGWDTAAARKTNASWNSENNVAQSISLSGWATKKPEPHNGYATKVQEPTMSNDWDAGGAWGRKDRDNKFTNETNTSKSWWGKVTDGDESGHHKNKNNRPEDKEGGTHGWDNKMSQEQSISGWAFKTTQEATTESLGWDSKGNSNPGDAACGWKTASNQGAENSNADKHWGKKVTSNQADTASGWGKPKSPEISLGWGKSKESVKSDHGWGVSSSGGGRDNETENQSLAGQGKESGGWDNKVTSIQADAPGGWGKPKSSENSQGWGLSKESVKEAHGWGVPNSVGGNGNEMNNNNENQSLVEQGKESGWDNKASSNQEGTASGWGKPKSPALSEGWGSPRESSKAVHGWGVPNSGVGNGSGRDQQWGQQSREFKKNRFEGSQGWGSNNGDWKNKRNRPSKLQEDSNASGIFTTTRQRLDMFTSQEQDILADIEPLMLSIRRIIHQTGYNDGDPLSADDQSYVLDHVFHYHPDKAVKMGAGIDHVTVSKHINFQESRCFYIVSTDGCKQDFSYRKCLENFIKGKYPDLADDFVAKYFARRGNRQRTPAPDGTEDEKQAV